MRDSGGFADFERLVLQQAVTVVALELMRRRVVRDTERRLAGDVLEEALSGASHEDELAGRMRPFGVGEECAVLLFDLPRPAQRGANARADALGDRRRCARCNPRRASVRRGRHSSWEPITLAEHARELLAERHGEVRAAASRRSPVETLRRSFHEARCALEVSALRNGDTRRSPRTTTSAPSSSCSVQDDEALRMYCESVLGTIEDGEGKYGGELLRSLEAFLEHNGQWEGAARELYSSPAHASVPHPPHRGADRSRPEQPATASSSARAARAGASCNEPVG